MPLSSLFDIRSARGRFARFAAMALCALALYLVLLCTLVKPGPALLPASGAIPLAIVAMVVIPDLRAKRL